MCFNMALLRVIQSDCLPYNLYILNLLVIFRYRRATHVTPKSYLNFIAGYKSIYTNKQTELSEGALRMDTGLEKLAEASSSVLILKKELAVMEKELADASQRAEHVLTEVFQI